mmetsp:Transcript_1291/g.2857  ORF Transcript_1291/g.2857 Transcript_1291/m.2857 type:complete len:216 (+) Transcript_1291:1221-1868(+)
MSGGWNGQHAVVALELILVDNEPAVLSVGLTEAQCDGVVRAAPAEVAVRIRGTHSQLGPITPFPRSGTLIWDMEDHNVHRRPTAQSLVEASAPTSALLGCQYWLGRRHGLCWHRLFRIGHRRCWTDWSWGLHRSRRYRCRRYWCLCRSRRHWRGSFHRRRRGIDVFVPAAIVVVVVVGGREVIVIPTVGLAASNATVRIIGNEGEARYVDKTRRY